MMRFSPRFLNVFFFAGRPAPFFPPSVPGVADASTGSFFAMTVSAFLGALDRFLLRDRALARALARARVRARALSVHGQVAAVPHPAPAADFHQPLDVHRDFLAEVSFHATLLFNHPADLPDVVFRQVLDADVGADARRGQDVVRPLPADAVDVGQADFDPLRAREIDTSNTCHMLLILVRSWKPDRSVSLQLPASSSSFSF